ncbi:MAG: ComEC/Rec2 family competence protein [Anaerolineae bacterium]
MPRRPRPGLLTALLLSCFLLGLLPALAAPQAVANGQLTVRFIDVGQGDSIWVQTPGGDDILVDGGPKNGRALAYLQSRGCDAIEYMVLTHPHADHVGGLVQVLNVLPVGEAWGTGEACTTQVCQEYAAKLAEQSLTAVTIRAPSQYAIGGVTLRLLHPGATLSGDTNNNSLVFRLSYGSVDVLLTGDIDSTVERDLPAQAVEAEVLKVAHHGSNYSSSAAFLAAVHPDVAVISVGKNGYGHPGADAMARLLATGAQLCRTDRQGTVSIMTDGTQLTVRVEKALRLPLVLR